MDFSSVRLLVYDCDGVLTDNRVYVGQDGREYAAFHRGDGYGIQLLRERGFSQIIISTEVNPIVEYRARKLKLPVIHGITDKKAVLLDHCQKTKTPLASVFYIGNDLNDLEAMEAAGFRGCPKDAEPEILAVCDWISTKNGGEGVIRELCRTITAQKRR